MEYFCMDISCGRRNCISLVGERIVLTEDVRLEYNNGASDLGLTPILRQ